MPGEQSPKEYYHIYAASQRRVERWVHETSKELQTAPLSVLPATVSDKQPIPPSEDLESPQPAEVRPRSRHRIPSSKDRTQESRSRSHPSSGSKTLGAKDHGSRHARPGRKKREALSFSTYLPFGVLPVLFAMTGSSALSIVIAIFLLAGYIYNMEEDTPSQIHA